MSFRIFVIIIFLTWCILPQRAAAQVVECPGLLSVPAAAPKRTTAIAKDLLGKFISILDLRGLNIFNETELVSRYARDPDALLIKLQDLDLQCLALSQDDQVSVDERQQVMRRLFLETVLTASDGSDADLQQAIKDIEGEIELSRKLSRELWFQKAEEFDDTNRWAVIVASMAAVTAWKELKAHQERWPQIHFELHVPYLESNPYYAIVVGWRLSRTNATKLVELVRGMGMASDSYLWALPLDTPEENLLAGGNVDRITAIENSDIRRADTQFVITYLDKTELPESEDPRQRPTLELIPAQFPVRAQGGTISLYDKIVGWWNWMTEDNEVLAASFRPDCGLGPGDQISGVSFCARDNDKDSGSGSQEAPVELGTGTGGG